MPWLCITNGFTERASNGSVDIVVGTQFEHAVRTVSRELSDDSDYPICIFIQSDHRNSPEISV